MDLSVWGGLEGGKADSVPVLVLFRVSVRVTAWTRAHGILVLCPMACRPRLCPFSPGPPLWVCFGHWCFGEVSEALCVLGTVSLRWCGPTATRALWCFGIVFIQ